MFGYKIYNTVIMDGSDRFANREITGIIDMMTKRKIGKSICRRLDRNHPTMMVIRRFTNPTHYWEAKRLINEKYPGYCAFDVKL